MRLPLEQYMIAQRVYDGWALFAVPIFGAIAALLAHTIMVRRHPRAFGFSLVSLLAVVATQGVFWAYTYPMNALPAVDGQAG